MGVQAKKYLKVKERPTRWMGGGDSNYIFRKNKASKRKGAFRRGKISTPISTKGGQKQTTEGSS